MNKRKVKKLMKPGTLFRVEGTTVVGMSLGYKGTGKIDSFNLVDIAKGSSVNRCDGKCHQATKREQACYWKVLRNIIGV